MQKGRMTLIKTLVPKSSIIIIYFKDKVASIGNE